jgi:flagellar protein FlgJ
VGSTIASTREYINGSAVSTTDRFKAYRSTADCFRDYVSLLGNSPRYASVCNTGSDVTQFATGLQQAGYATDPAYASKLQATAATVAKLADPAGLASTPRLRHAGEGN